MKAQYQSTETIKLRFSPFIDRTTNLPIMAGLDTCTVYWVTPSGGTGNIAMVWNPNSKMWTKDFAPGTYYAAGEWQFRAESSDVTANPQWKVIIWADYVEQLATIGTTLGTPAGASISADIAAVAAAQNSLILFQYP